jgi:hypothetical protein
VDVAVAPAVPGIVALDDPPEPFDLAPGAITTVPVSGRAVAAGDATLRASAVAVDTGTGVAVSTAEAADAIVTVLAQPTVAVTMSATAPQRVFVGERFDVRLQIASRALALTDLVLAVTVNGGAGLQLEATPVVPPLSGLSAQAEIVWSAVATERGRAVLKLTVSGIDDLGAPASATVSVRLRVLEPVVAP